MQQVVFGQGPKYAVGLPPYEPSVQKCTLRLPVCGGMHSWPLKDFGSPGTPRCQTPLGSLTAPNWHTGLFWANADWVIINANVSNISFSNFISVPTLIRKIVRLPVLHIKCQTINSCLPATARWSVTKVTQQRRKLMNDFMVSHFFCLLFHAHTTDTLFTRRLLLWSCGRNVGQSWQSA